ncbi:hypothetical protein L1987_32866 [Smallanthus sonchifolius]|uniref:Uncharacterized protein n=1 Tax=Smallanthus sonchifolius TaxID=185202 RepID=A0ACB9HQT2_9ASTR|nr:hypothetical protein L1987_32866 [Smallanthus sonchifolius]
MPKAIVHYYFDICKFILFCFASLAKVSSAYRGEFSVISKIVQEIMINMQPNGRDNNLIGIESHIDALNPLLSIQTTEGVHIIGIFGMGGIDIACFFKGREVEDVTRILDSFGFHPVIGISVLIEKSLITISKGKIVIEAIVVPRDQDWKHGFEANVFERMNSLRLLDVDDKFTYQEPSLLPDGLIWIRWNHYPFSSLPLPHTSKVIGLEMEYTKIQYLWKGQKIMPNLKFIHMSDLDCLTRFPDVSEAPNIVRLILARCGNLVVVHESLGFLKRLVYLNISQCMKLKCLPCRFEMESLDTLQLINRPSLERIPEFSSSMVKLSSLDLYSCSEIEELPSSIRYLTNLSFLNLEHCVRLENIPNSICELKCLKHLRLNGCSKLQKWPDQFSSMQNLEELTLGHAKFFNFRDLANLCSLRKLDLISNHISEEDFPRNFNEFLGATAWDGLSS